MRDLADRSWDDRHGHLRAFDVFFVLVTSRP
jgi:hypothetical protein